MTVNNGGNLSKEYFIAYFMLIMNAKNFTLEQAQAYIVNHFFKQDLNSFGMYSYSSYLKAVEELTFCRNISKLYGMGQNTDGLDSKCLNYQWQSDNAQVDCG